MKPIKYCPFCGSEPVIFRTDCDPPAERTYYVECTMCCTSQYTGGNGTRTYDEAAAAWNLRAYDHTRHAAMMWLEYAMEGDEWCKKATGHDAATAMQIAHSLLDGVNCEGYKFASEAHAMHLAQGAVENAQYMARGTGSAH